MGQPGDVTVISTLSIQNGANAPIARGADISDAWINTLTHTTRDALPTAVTTLGTLVRTLSDGIVWEVTSVGPVVYSVWAGFGGVTSWNTRVGAVVPASGDYAASQVTNDSSVTGTGVKGALNTLLASIAGLVTGVSSVFGRAGAVVAAVGDYLASQVTNNSATVPGAHVSDALDALRLMSSGLVFADITHLIAYDATLLTGGAGAAVLVPDDLYEYFPSPSSSMVTATDGVNIIQPTTPNTARWARRGLAYSYVSDWYVDTAGGNDANDGSSSHKLKTFDELKARLFPSGKARKLFQATTVHAAPGTYSEGFFARLDGNSFGLTLQGDFTLGAGITLSAVVNTVQGTTTPGSGTRGEIQTASGTFVVGQMLQCTSGSNVGAIAYVQELVSATHAFVTMWHTSPLTTRGTQVNLAIGDVVSVVTNNVEIPTFYLETSGLALIRVANIGAGASTMNYAARPAALFGVLFDAGKGFWGNDDVKSSAAFQRCQGGWFSPGGYIQYQGGNHFNENYLYAHTKIDFSGGDCITGAGLQFYDCQVGMGFDWTARTSGGGMQFERGTGAALTIGNTAFTQQANLTCWGVTGAGANAGIVVQGNSVLNSAAPFPTIAATTQVSIAGKAYTYAEMPVWDTGSNSGFIGPNSANGTISLTAQSNVIAATNVYSAIPAKGHYGFGTYLTVTSSAGGAGYIAVFATFTDDTGVSQKVQITSWLDVSVPGSADGLRQIRTSGTAHIQYSVESDPSHTFTHASLAYNFSLSVERKAVN